jgi:S1-C subfamily serine protease
MSAVAGRRLTLVAGVLVALIGAFTVTAVTRERSWRAELAATAAREGDAREELARTVAEAGRRADALRGEIRTLAAILREHERRLDARDRHPRGSTPEGVAWERLLETYAPGVALIQATVRYEDSAGRPLRYRGADARRPWRGQLGPPPVAVGGEGPIVTETFIGTGFLVDRDGTMLTGRHVARPWETEEQAEALHELGVRARLHQLRAFFPALTEPVPLTPARMSESADLMLLEAKLAPGTVPVLPLEPAAAVPGRAVMFLGYPAGLDLLLARVPPAVVQDLLPEDVTEIADDTVDMSRLLGELARRRLIRPHASWGRLAEVRPHVLTHDARTTMGGSGGPIFGDRGRVVGVTHAVLPAVDGVAFGIPVGRGLALLRGRPFTKGAGELAQE